MEFWVWIDFEEAVMSRLELSARMNGTMVSRPHYPLCVLFRMFFGFVLFFFGFGGVGFC